MIKVPVFYLSGQRKITEFKLLKTQASGIVDALNFGISKSNSDLIARMDGDDLMHPNRLEEQSKFLQHNKALGVVSCEVIHFTHSKEHTKRRLCSPCRVDQSDSFS